VLRIKPRKERCAQQFAKKYWNQDEAKYCGLLMCSMGDQQQQKSNQNNNDSIGPECAQF